MGFKNFGTLIQTIFIYTHLLIISIGIYENIFIFDTNFKK